MALNIVLHEPEIPHNTGNIGRICVATGTALHLIRPLGFSLDDRNLRRAGLDYWPHLKLFLYDSFEDFMEKNPGARIFMATTKAHRTYAEVEYGPDDFIMFGKETAGIPEEILVDHEEDCIRIPMNESIRSLNLSNAAAIVLYEALRQQNFLGLQEYGALHRLEWKSKGADA